VRLPQVIIIPQRNEYAVAPVTSISPFEESDLTDQLRFHPAALFHLLHSERLSFAPLKDLVDGRQKQQRQAYWVDRFRQQLT
jgi:hypothetical protein